MTFGILFLIGWLLTATSYGSDSMSAEDLLSLHEQNCRQARSVAVHWNVKETTTDAYLAYQRSLVAAYREEAKRVSTPELKVQIQALEKNIENLELAPTNHWSVLVLVDDHNLQIRAPTTINPVHGRVANPKRAFGAPIPFDAPSPELLESVFESTTILSVGRATDNKVRSWNWEPRRSDGRFIGTVSAEGAHLPGYLIPPLLSPQRFVPCEPHLIDEFFAGQSAEYELIGTSQIDGREMIALERSYQFNGTRSKIRGYLDVERGAIPVRLEQGWWESSRPVPSSLSNKFIDTNLYRLTIIDDIKNHEGDYWYPVAGADYLIGITDVEKDSNGNVRYATAPTRITTWNIVDVKVNPPVDDSWFALEYPAGTMFFDHGVGHTMIAGGDAESTRRMIVGLTQPRVPPVVFWRRWSILIVAISVALIGSGVVIWLKKRA